MPEPRRHRSDQTCQWLCESLDAARQRLNFDLWAFVFMPDHVHLILHPRDLNYETSTILHDIKQPTSRRAVAYLRKHAPQWLERIAVHKGGRVRYQFWQKGGGFDRNIIEPNTLFKMIDYLHLNPVRRGLVQRASEFKWSSAAWYEGLERSPLRIDPMPHEWCPKA